MQYSAMLGFVVAMLAAGQERPAVEAVSVTGSVQSASLRTNAGTYTPGDIKVLGVVDYGKTQLVSDQAAKQRYRAFVFSGYGGDRVEIALKSGNPSSSFVVTDSTLNEIGSGKSTVTVGLPFRGPDVEVYYIVFPNTRSTAQLSVRVRKVGRDMSVPSIIEPRPIPETRSTGAAYHLRARHLAANRPAI